MESIRLHVLGCGSAKPSNGHLPSSQILEMRGKMFMLDCGEGTLMQWSKSGLGMSRLGHIFISHSHGDHCFGLPGMISTMGMLGRTAELHIHAPADVRPFVDCILTHFCQDMPYQVLFHEVGTHSFHSIYEDRSVQVWSIPLQHRVPCVGYLFKEKAQLPHIRPEMLACYDIPLSQVNNIKAGVDWVSPEGETIPWQRLTRPADPPRSYAYCTDTRYLPRIAPYIEGVDVLYHEATFNDALAQRAQRTYHSTARQAAQLAQLASVKQLLIGHYSARIKDEASHLLAAQEVFPQTLLAHEGQTLEW